MRGPGNEVGTTQNLSRNVSKLYARQVVSLMNEQQSQNLLLKVDPLSTIRNNELIAQGEELEKSAKLRGFVSNTAVSRKVVQQNRTRQCQIKGIMGNGIHGP